MANLGVARGSIVIDGSGAAKGFDQASKSMGGFIKKTAAIAGGVGIAATVRNMGREVLGFQTIMADTQAVSGATAREMGQLAAQAKQFGSDAQFGARGARQVAMAQTELAKAGLDVQQIFGALPGTLALAAAGDMEVADAAVAASNASKMFGLEASQLTRVADQLATAANVTTADVRDFVEATESGGSAAKTAGMNYDQFMLSMTALAEVSVQGAEAGTSFRSAMAQIANPTKAAQKEMDRLNLSFFDADGRMRDVKDISGQLNRAFKDQTQQQRLAAMQTIAGTYGYRTLFALWDQGPEKLADLEKALQREGSAAEVAAIKNDTASVAWRSFYQEIVNGALGLGDKALPTITALGVAATGFVQDLVAGTGPAGESLHSLGAAASATLPVFAGLVSMGGEVAGVALAILAPIAGLTAEFMGSSTGAALLRAALIGLAAAYIAGKAGALGLLAVQKAQAIYASAAAFMQLASTVRSTADAMRLLQATTMMSPIGLVAAGVGVAVTAIGLLTSAFSSGPSAAERYKDALDKVAGSAQTTAQALDAARNAVSSITGAQFQAAQSILNVRSAQEEYTRAVRDHGKGSAEARAAEANLRVEQENRRQAAVKLNESASRSTQEMVAQGTAIQKRLGEERALVAASADKIKTDEAALALAQRLGQATPEMTEAIKEAKLEHAKHGKAVQDSNKNLAAWQREAKEAADALTGDTTPSAQEARAALMAIAEADPGELSKVIASVEAGTSQATDKAKTGANNVKAALQGMGNVSISFGGLLASVNAGLQAVVNAARGKALLFRGAMALFNTNQRASPSPNEIIAGGLRDTDRIVNAGLARVATTAERQGERIHRTMSTQAARTAAAMQTRLSFLSNIQALLDPLEASARHGQMMGSRPVKEPKPKNVTAKNWDARYRKELLQWQRESQAELLSSMTGQFGNLASAARDAMSMIGQAMQDEFDAVARQLDANLAASLGAAEARYNGMIAAIDQGWESSRIREIDGFLAQADEARRLADEAKRRAEASEKSGAADKQVERMRQVLAAARTASERQAAQSLLDQAITEQQQVAAEIAEMERDFNAQAMQRERDHLAQQVQARRDAAQAELDAARVAAEQLHAQETAAAEQRILAQKAALERQTNDLIYQLDRGLISAKKFQQEMGKVLGNPAAVRSMNLSGAKLGLAFARGLEDSKKDIHRAVSSIGRLVANYLKLRSPAKEGPLAYDFSKSGRTLALDFARGMARSRSLVAHEAARVAYAANPAAAGVSSAGAAGGGSFNQTNNIRVDGSVDPRQLSEQLWFAGMYGPTTPGGD